MFTQQSLITQFSDLLFNMTYHYCLRYYLCQGESLSDSWCVHFFVLSLSYTHKKSNWDWLTERRLQAPACGSLCSPSAFWLPFFFFQPILVFLQPSSEPTMFLLYSTRHIKCYILHLTPTGPGSTAKW